MYGATMQETEEAKKLLPTQSPQRRRDFRLRREGGSRSIVANAREKQPAVLNTIFSEPKKKERAEQLSPTSPEAIAAATRGSRYSFLYVTLNPNSKRWQAMIFKRFIATVILLDVIMFIISTDRRISRQYGRFFDASEAIVSCIFLVEYVLRLYTITERPRYGSQGPILGRVSYMLTTSALIDLVATAPFFIEAASMGTLQLPQTTYLRVFRLFRILRTAAVVRALDAVYRVMYYNAEILQVATLVCLVLILVTACMLYYLRPNPLDNTKIDDDDDFSHLDEFHSLPATLYLSTLMLTGQGGPDERELPWYTRVVVLITAVFSIGMFAIPASMVTWGFEAEAERMAKRARRRALREAMPDQPGGYSSTSSEDDASTDEEYFRIIAGAEEDEDENNQQEEDPVDQRRLETQEMFDRADNDGDGTLTIQELWQMREKQGFGGADKESINRLTQRMEDLERRVSDNTKKLDQILEILQAQKKGGGFFR